MASDIERKIEKYIRYGQIYAASPATIARVIVSNLDVRERQVDRVCPFSWENLFGERVRCTEDRVFHGDRHVNDQSWVAVGHEASARRPFWRY